MSNDKQRLSDEINWKLGGIRAERTRVQERLDYLTAEESRLINAGVIGAQTKTAANGKTKTAAKTKRKRVLSPETREKMRQAAAKRWNKQPAQTPTVTTGAAVPPPIE